NEQFEEKGLTMFRSQDFINDINQRAENRPVLYHLNIISTVLTDYFSIFSNMQDYFPKTKIFHQYALLLSNNYVFNKLIDSCTYYSAHQSMYRLINRYLRQREPNHVQLAPAAKYLKDNPYQIIKDSVSASDTAKAEVTEKLLYYYPNELGESMGAEIIEFDFFEQVIAIELLDIISKNKIIKKCPACDCGKYFIANSKIQKYCDDHKNQHASHQKNYVQKKKIENPYQSILDEYKQCLKARIKRSDLSKEKYDEWLKGAEKLICSLDLQKISEQDFITELDSICKKLKFKSRRAYNKNSKGKGLG
ncbi:MAG: DUF6076 domain-containing protein, partial [Ruminococcus flavefaciens]|nr:DUF6076 domain-containing protein [Ruminococcus flavefaciens]